MEQWNNSGDLSHIFIEQNNKPWRGVIELLSYCDANNRMVLDVSEWKYIGNII